MNAETVKPIPEMSHAEITRALKQASRALALLIAQEPPNVVASDNRDAWKAINRVLRGE